MSFNSLGDRMKDYEENHNLYLTRRLPVIIRADGVGFSRLTGKLAKPSEDFIHCMANTMLYSIKEIGGAILGFTQSDEITFVLRNDLSINDEPWLSNRVQKIISRIASLTTKGFERSLEMLDVPLDLVGEALFDVRATALPDLNETLNCLIWRQQDCQRNALSMATLSQLSEKMSYGAAVKFLHQKSSKDRLKILEDECKINFEEFYSSAFRHGVATYKVPNIQQDAVRNKWVLNFDLPIFAEDKNFLNNILINGRDIIRAPKE